MTTTADVTASDYMLLPLKYEYGYSILERAGDAWHVRVHIPRFKEGSYATQQIAQHDLSFEEAKKWAVMAHGKAEELWKLVENLTDKMDREAALLLALPDVS